MEFLRLGHIAHRDWLDARHLAVANRVWGDDAGDPRILKVPRFTGIPAKPNDEWDVRLRYGKGANRTGENTRVSSATSRMNRVRGMATVLLVT